MDEKVDPYPLIWADATMRPHQPGKTRLSPKHHSQWHGWVTHVRIDENPGIRGHDLCFDKRAKETASLNALRWNSKTIRIKTWPWRDVTLWNTSVD